jgi:hypothetical protein
MFWPHRLTPEAATWTIGMNWYEMNSVKLAKFLITGVVVASAVFCQTQQPKKPLRVFKPTEFHAIDPLIAKDEGCAKDLAKASRMEGLEQRKFLADLFIYGCVRFSPGPHLVQILALREFGEGDKKVHVSRVEMLSSKTNETLYGWILSDNLISRDLIDKVIAAMEQKRSEQKQ